jgi:hypothetical protein
MRAVTSSRKAAEKYVKGDLFLLNGMMSAWYTHNLTNVHPTLRTTKSGCYSPHTM